MKKIVLLVLTGLGVTMIAKPLLEAKNKITTHITDFKLKGWKDGAFWFSIKVAFDNDSTISIPLSSLAITIFQVMGTEKSLLAKSKPATDKYVLKAGTRTELDDILISVGLLSLPSSAMALLQRFTTNTGTMLFDVVAEARAAGHSVTEIKQFKV